MAGALDFFEDDLLEHLFLNATVPNVGTAGGLRGSTTGGAFAISTHTALPADSATTQGVSEAAYTGYERQSAGRTTTVWSVASGVADNDNAITYSQAGSTETQVAFGIGYTTTPNTTTAVLQITGSLTSALVVTSGVTAEFAAGALDVSID